MALCTEVVPAAAGEWTVEMVARLAGDGVVVPDGKLASLTDLLVRTAGVRAAAVGRGEDETALHATLTVEADRRSGALERAEALLRAGARYAGLGGLAAVSAMAQEGRVG